MKQFFTCSWSSKRRLLIMMYALLFAGADGQASPPQCPQAAIHPQSDMQYLIGSASYVDEDNDEERYSAYRWYINAAESATGTVAQTFAVSFDDTVNGAGNERPAASEGVLFSAGKWGHALNLSTTGMLVYSVADNYPVHEGTIEMWISLRDDASTAIYTNRSHTLFQYRTPNGEYTKIFQSAASSVIYAAGWVSNQWQSAYSGKASMLNWATGEWHHVAYTYSTTNNSMQFYHNGILVADSNEGHYWPPATNGATFTVGSDYAGSVAAYYIDDFRIHNRRLSPQEILLHATRLDAPADFEVWLPTSSLNTNDLIRFEYTPVNRVESGSSCISDEYLYRGIPITDAVPPSMLLAPGTESIEIAVDTKAADSCRYALGNCLSYSNMTPFDLGAGATHHTTLVTGLKTNITHVNVIYIRCASEPSYVKAMQYRVRGAVNPSYPRTGNLWGWHNYSGKPQEEVAKIDLWMGVNASGMAPETMRKLRELNPDVLILASINAVERQGLPEDYYLKDIHGNRVEVWPNIYRLNVTKPYVAEAQARYGAQLILDGELQFDGCFFDNVFMDQSRLTQDIYGTPFISDYNEDGLADDPAAFDAAWRAGVIHELETFNELMPHAINCGHAMPINEAVITNSFNGISIGFHTTDTIERNWSFSQLWTFYERWSTEPRKPHVNMVESAPHDQISYGYGYGPYHSIPASTLQFAQSYYPYVRFGLTFTLLQDGYFAHEFGDIWHGNDWWYDELDYNLGYPLNQAELLGVYDTNKMGNAGFEFPIEPPWHLLVVTSENCQAALVQDTNDFCTGQASACVTIESTSTTDWHVTLEQREHTLQQGTSYQFRFKAKSNAHHPISVTAIKGAPDWRNYGLFTSVTLTTNWQNYTINFTAKETAADAKFQFLLGHQTGTIWIDDVELVEVRSSVYRRVFDHGLVLLNATHSPQEFAVGPGYRRLTGTQAPLCQYIIDDIDPAFTLGGTTQAITNDSGEWNATPPFFHDWGPQSYELVTTSSWAQWEITVPTNDIYSIYAWWAATPSNTWCREALYEVVAGQTVIASTSLNQRVNGDQWHLIAQVPLVTGQLTSVRIRPANGEPCIADAIHIHSSKRYNDGSTADVVSLQPMDGIILARDETIVADTDSDQLPDAWEIQHFGGPTSAVATNDSDGDSQTNLDEWLSGSNPTNDQSFFELHILDAPVQLDQIILNWNSAPDRFYDIYFTDDMRHRFSNVVNNIPAMPVLNVYTVTSHQIERSGYFQIKVCK